MDPQQGQPALQIGDYLAILRLRRWLVLAIAAVFTIGGVLYPDAEAGLRRHLRRCCSLRRPSDRRRYARDQS